MSLRCGAGAGAPQIRSMSWRLGDDLFPVPSQVSEPGPGENQSRLPR